MNSSTEWGKLTVSRQDAEANLFACCLLCPATELCERGNWEIVTDDRGRCMRFVTANIENLGGGRK